MKKKERKKKEEVLKKKINLKGKARVFIQKKKNSKFNYKALVVFCVFFTYF